YIKKRETNFPLVKYYLNSLLLLLIALDTTLLLAKVIRGKNIPNELPAGFTFCDTCTKPDIFFIVPDEYVGDQVLRDIFSFNNSAFQQELDKRGFHTIAGSKSNYNYTPFSLASLLNMEYLEMRMTKQG